MQKNQVLYFGEVVGGAGFEPATSTMSTWRSTPELTAPIPEGSRKILKQYNYRKTYHAYSPAPLTGISLGHAEGVAAHCLDLVPEFRGLLEFEVARVPEHLLLELGCFLQKLRR